MGFRKTLTDGEGLFSFNRLSSSPLQLLITSPGFSPFTRLIHSSSEDMKVEWVLSKGKPLSLKIIDPKGNPLAGVEAVVKNMDSWDGEILSLISDKDGLIQWANAPDEKFDIHFSKEGYISKFKTFNGEQNEEIQLNPHLVISGSVLDAETGEPINSYKLLWSSDADYFPYESKLAVINDESDFKFDLGKLHDDAWYGGYAKTFVFKVEAPGYLPFTSRVFHYSRDFGEMVYNISL